MRKRLVACTVFVLLSEMKKHQIFSAHVPIPISSLDAGWVHSKTAKTRHQERKEGFDGWFG